MKPIRYYSVALLILTSFFFAGCDLPLLEKSPSKVVEAFFEAANEGKYSEAESYLSSESKNLLGGTLGAMAGGVKGFCDNVTRNGSISRLEITSEQIRGEGAVVMAIIHFKDGTSEDDKTSFLKEGGNWKIAP